MWLRLILFVLMSLKAQALICTRRPGNTATPKSPVDENYVISITGNPETYILGQEYNGFRQVVLFCKQIAHSLSLERFSFANLNFKDVFAHTVSLNAFNGHRYISFILALENENGDFSYMYDLGRFELNDPIETRFSPNCINMVENTNTNPKTHNHLTWVAPSEPGSGCILIRATLVQHRDVWHMDDGGLTRRICEEVVDDVESQPSGPIPEVPCCACDEARYELIFEGAWSRNLHPRFFPARGWETRFCELLGAAHSSDYRFWESGALASEALKQYAEHCSSRLLEREFSHNFRDQKIRTIIKARGPAYPNLNSKSIASVRVDPVHHMVSFASKIEPSPDWIVGISGLELCLRNCTWLEEKVIKLYPWDVGTDAGPSYTSPDQPQLPPDVIRRMRSDFPNDPRSPFYDPAGAPMKPMAVLTVRRQRIFERRCADEDSNNDADVPRECLTHPWSSFSDCSSKCGAGMQYRRRVYKQPELARIYTCNVSQYEERECQGELCGQNYPMRIDADGDYDELQMGGGQSSQRAECQLGPWGSWSSCSVTCGEGYQLRHRQYLNPGAELKCQNVHRLELQEMRKCSGRDCLGAIDGDMEDTYGRAAAEIPEQESFGSRNSPGYYNEDRDEPLPGGFEVGNLKGSNFNTYQNAPNQRQPFRQIRPNYPEERNRETPQQRPPLLEDIPRSSWQQPPPSENVERTSWQQQRTRPLNNFQPDLPPIDRESERDAWLPGNTNSISELDDAASVRCFQMLRTAQPLCQNQTVMGHFWFYNFCADECMLYASDPCDRNINKFSRWEQCEQCRQPELAMLRQQYANTQECQMIMASLRADQRMREEQRPGYNYNSSRRRQYGSGGSQRG